MALPASAETLRIATFNTDLARDGPGLLLRDILKGADDVLSARAAVDAVAPDIIALQSFDYDLTGAALSAFVEGLGRDYPHRFALLPNTGMPSGIDLNGDRRLGTERDAQGFGRFHGQGGMAILSRYPVLTDAVVDHSAFIWSELEGGLWAAPDVLTEAARPVQRLSTTGHWEVPVAIGQNVLTLLTYHATPPVFDGPEDRNGRRNADETLFWLSRMAEVENPILLGDANLDPARGDGRSEAMQTLLANPLLQDPLAGTDSVVFEQTGPLRVDYVLHAAALRVVDAGLHWPTGDDASRHAVIWVDIAVP